MSGVAWLAGGLFVRLFTTDAVVAGKATWAIRVCTLALIPLGLQYEVVDGFTAIGRCATRGHCPSGARPYTLPRYSYCPPSGGAEATFYAEAISDVVGPLASVAIHALVMKKLVTRRAMTGA